jgi:hypothetical protein
MDGEVGAKQEFNRQPRVKKDFAKSRGSRASVFDVQPPFVGRPVVMLLVKPSRAPP